jgi:hypothetical protein
MSQNMVVRDGKIVFLPKESVKGKRICPQCGLTEAQTLAKNSNYSFVSIIVRKSDEYQKNQGKAQDASLIGTKQMGCVYCYNKNRSKASGQKELSLEKIREVIKEYQGYERAILEAQKQSQGNSEQKNSYTAVPQNETSKQQVKVLKANTK